MTSRFVTIIALTIAALTFPCITGCETEAQNSALLGTAIGAGIGALAGGDTEGALIGGAIGGGVGYMAGSESEKKKTQQEIEGIRAEQNTITVWITNSNGSKVPVKLRKDGPSYIGPKGEYYDTMPTEDELKQLYGF